MQVCKHSHQIVFNFKSAKAVEKPEREAIVRIVSSLKISEQTFERIAMMLVDHDKQVTKFLCEINKNTFRDHFKYLLLSIKQLISQKEEINSLF